jgi:rSAM/selenodomain-associated transferase 1
MYRADSAPVLPACGIAVMAKVSIAGKTKTRLCPPLTFEQAAALNTAFLQDVATNILAAAKIANIGGYFAFGPTGAQSADFFHSIMPRGFALLEAWHANFGDSLYSAIEQMFSLGHESALVLNADSPTLPTALLVDAAQALARAGERAVLGPSTDGGYYLLGMKAPHRHLFEDVAWSTDQVARQTLARAAEIGLPVHILPTWYDVDDVASLQRLHAELFGYMDPSGGLQRYAAEHSKCRMGALLTSRELAVHLGSSAILPARAAE